MVGTGAAALPAVIFVVFACATSCRHADVPAKNSPESTEDWLGEPHPSRVATVGNYVLTVNTNGHAIITGFNQNYAGSVSIPDTLNVCRAVAPKNTSLFGRTKRAANIIPYRVTEISFNAFSKCKGLTEITIPDSVNEIKINAFEGCSSLTNMLVDAENPNYSSTNGVLFNKARTRLFLCPNGRSGSYTIPDGVVEIGSCAFIGCTSLTDVIIPNTVTYIGFTAFANCERLKSILVSSSVDNIEFNAFTRCPGLTSIHVDPDNAKFSSVDGVLYNKGKTRLILFPSGKSGTYTLPAEVAKIEPESLSSCSGLTNILVDAESAQFSSTNGVLFNKGRTSLILCPRGKSGTYTIPDGVSEIATGAFSNCANLTNISIPEGVATIAGYAFWECTALTDITIPDTVTSIGEKAFFLCRKLTNIAIPKGVTTIENGTFYACMELANITIPEGVTQIRKLAFYGCRNLTSVVIPNSVSLIEDDAFTGCSGMTNITTSGRIDRIGQFAFSYCPGLTSIPQGVTNYWGPLIPRRDWPGRKRPLK